MKMVENKVEKGEIALATVFSEDLYRRHIKTGLVWERVNH